MPAPERNAALKAAVEAAVREAGALAARTFQTSVKNWTKHGGSPVSEVTIAGHLNDIFASLTAANDLEFRYGTNAPTVRLEGLTVAGT